MTKSLTTKTADVTQFKGLYQCMQEMTQESNFKRFNCRASILLFFYFLFIPKIMRHNSAFSSALLTFIHLFIHSFVQYCR